MNTIEAWRPIPGWEGCYEVSSHGRVKSLARMKDGRWGRSTAPVSERILRPAPDGDGYPTVALQRDGRRRTAKVHALVLAAFVGPRPAGMHACHGDGSRANNHIENLRWDTPSGNQADSVRHGTHPNASKERCPKGHLYDEANTYRPTRGGRNCRACGRENRREYRARRVAA